MDCNRCLSLAFLFSVLQALSVGQIPPARQVLEMPESDQIAFVISTINQGLPEDRAEQMTMLIINRSQLVAPLLEAAIEGALREPSPASRLIDIASEMIAYAGDEQSLRAVSKLIALDERRFGHLVGRTLDNSMNWRNPFTIAYRGLGIGDPAVARYAVAWSASALSSDRMKHLWSEALLDRLGKVPDQAEWARDPLASRLPNAPDERLRQTVVRYAADAQKKRETR
jgi:hypothetical protein